MIQIMINRTISGAIQSFAISGHAFFDERGKDIVCAGVSAVSVGAINAVHELTGIAPDIEHDENGFLRCTVPEDLPKEVHEKIQLLFEGMLVALQTIEEQYGTHIKITYKKQEVE
ncbi:ribosomal-processing cysteine protease Prp [Bacillus sp. T33-2]|uniref:ribosomal-processing cysteine protease Prp n=1 Tax=Bacillus sp. T33-2 TaxID=2054168 RepID=UPI000C75FC9D|nr:ribosomal-processing cysteine protease Prp [Bacillus sp. T33-2]PLR93727.1 ribosomal-processing cysteine protease Prp [Bacillus sp. T33-2]